MDRLPIDANVRIDGYDLAAEKNRYRFPDVTLGGRTINRGTVRVELAGEMEAPGHQAVRDEHLAQMYITTHDADSPVLELGFPVAGPYVACRAGVYMDLMLGCAQKILDENHPFFRDAVRHLLHSGVMLRREINTDDFITSSAEGVRTPQELAALLNRAARARFVSVKGWRTFFCNSGTEAIEASMKLACLVRWRRLEQTAGGETIARVMADLGIERDPFPAEKNGEELWRDYPMFLVATESAFHGRTLGALNLTRSKRAHQIGYPKLRWVRHIKYNGSPKQLDDILDVRPLAEIVAAPGGVKAVVAAGRIPKDLCAAFVAEGFQGEGGYLPGDRTFFEGIASTCRRHGILLIADEVQTMGRTGKLFAFEHLNVAPDIIALAKASFIGACIARADFEAHLHGGWHSNTWGGGKIFDVNMAYAGFDALLNYEDPVFDGKSYLENIGIKGRYLLDLLEKVKARHPETVVAVRGRGGMIGLVVKNRHKVVETGWRRGLKMLGAGLAGDVSAIRLLIMADSLTKEMEEIATKLDEVLAEVEAKAPAGAAK